MLGPPSTSRDRRVPPMAETRVIARIRGRRCRGRGAVLLLVLVMVGIAHPVAPSSAPARRRSSRERAPSRHAQDVRARVIRTSMRWPAVGAAARSRSAVSPRMGQRRHAGSRSPRARARRDAAVAPRRSRAARRSRRCAAALFPPATIGARRSGRLNSARWFDAVAIDTGSDQAAEYPGRKFTVQCADIASAATCSRARTVMHAALSWRGTEVERVMAHWREQFVG